MPDPTKPGFWQTVPGLMTATAGILSAATGALVTLNQTGVVDLKQLAGTKPAAQSSPLEAQTAPASPENKPSAPTVAPESGVADTKKQEVSSAPPTTTADAKTANPDTARTAAETENKPAVPFQPRPQYDPRPQPRSRDDAATPNLDTRERAPQTTEREESQPPSATARDKPKPTGSVAERETVPTSRQPERAPPVPAGKDDATRREPDAQEPVAKARRQDEPPSPARPADRDPRKPRVLQQGPDEPRSVGKAKASADPQEPKPGEDGKKDKAASGKEDKKKPEPASGPSTSGAGPLALTGLKLTVPAGWVKEEVQPSPMGPVAVFKIPKTEASSDDGAVRITHYPNMKGKEKDDRNIDRWIGQVAKPDGSPMTRPDAKITTSELGSVRLTVVDLTGAVKMTMRDAAKPNHRMIAAIVDHPQGPHFVVTAGPVASMDKWASQIDAFLKTAKVE